MLATAAKTSMRGTLDAAKRAVPYLIAHNAASTIADVAKKRKMVDIDVKHSQEPQLKKSFVDTGGIDMNALIDGSWYCIGQTNDWGIYTRTSHMQ